MLPDVLLCLMNPRSGPSRKRAPAVWVTSKAPAGFYLHDLTVAQGEVSHYNLTIVAFEKHDVQARKQSQTYCRTGRAAPGRSD